jgi:hypothetical protein
VPPPRNPEIDPVENDLTHEKDDLDYSTMTEAALQDPSSLKAEKLRYVLQRSPTEN